VSRNGWGQRDVTCFDWNVSRRNILFHLNIVCVKILNILPKKRREERGEYVFQHHASLKAKSDI